jgi:hypothetical protein
MNTKSNNNIKVLCAGGVGGEREVQPGDELLQYCSSAHRVLYSSSSSTIPDSSKSSTSADIKKVKYSSRNISLLLCLTQS